MGGPVGVEVVEHDEPSAGGFGPGEHAVLERWELLGPAGVVPCVEAEVHGVGAGGDLGGEGGVGRVAADRGGAVEPLAPAAADGGDLMTGGDELR